MAMEHRTEENGEEARTAEPVQWRIRDETQRMELYFESDSQNESFARVAAAAFMARLDPTLEETDDVKTAVSEAVTNAIIHGYAKKKGIVRISAEASSGENGGILKVEVEDWGCGIPDVRKAMEPMYSGAGGQERSGMGFCFMEAFMDELLVRSEPGKGTCVQMIKNIQRKPGKEQVV